MCFVLTCTGANATRRVKPFVRNSLYDRIWITTVEPNKRKPETNLTYSIDFNPIFETHHRCMLQEWEWNLIQSLFYIFRFAWQLSTLIRHKRKGIRTKPGNFSSLSSHSIIPQFLDFSASSLYPFPRIPRKVHLELKSNTMLVIPQPKPQFHFSVHASD